MAPKINNRLLQEDMAQTVRNANLESGHLKPLNINGQPADLIGNEVQTYYRYKFGGTTYNLEFNEDVDVVPGPIADDAFDRLYWTGQSTESTDGPNGGGNNQNVGGFPRMASSTEITTLGTGPTSYPRGSFRLGIETPLKTPVAQTPTGTDDGTQIKYSTAYVYTYVTPFGEEGPPSAASNVVTKVDGQTVLVTNIGAVPRKSKTSWGTRFPIAATVSTTSGSPTLTVVHDGSFTLNVGDPVALEFFGDVGGIPADAINSTFNIATVINNTTFTVTSNPSTNATSTATSNPASGTLGLSFHGTKRIYRSNTGSNTTDFQFVAEIPMTDNGYSDSKNNDQLGEVIPSTFWVAPPDEDSQTYPNGPMQGLTAIGNGIFAGFSGKRLCFSEPFLPHAWPIAYRVTLEDEIVGISMAGNVLFIGTKGTNYIAAGTDPQAMSIQKLEAAEPLLHKKSLVDMGGYCLYSGPDGLIAVENGQVVNVTEELIQGKLWNTTGSGGYMARAGARHENKYIGHLYQDGSSRTTNLSQSFSLEIGAGLNSFTIIDNVVSDLDSTRRNFRGFFTDPDTNRLSVIKGGQNVGGSDTTSTTCQVEEFDTFSNTWRATQPGASSDLYNPDNTRREVLWQSKEIVLEKPTSMAFVKVVCDTYDHGGVKINVFGREASNVVNSGHTISDAFQILSATIVQNGSQLQVSGTSSIGNTNNPQSFPTSVIAEPILRLPRGLFKEYSVTVSTHNELYEICLEESMDELRAL